jgi:hypothetical protein
LTAEEALEIMETLKRKEWSGLTAEELEERNAWMKADVATWTGKKWITDYKHPDGTLCAIEESRFYNLADKTTSEHFYMYAWATNEAYDYLQDTLEAAKDDALEYFGVPMDSWKEVEEFPEEIARLL